MMLAIAALLLSPGSAAIAAGKTSTDLVPLKLYWNLDRADRFDTANPEGEKDAKNASYEFVRTEGYVFANSHPGMVPLKLYWNPDRPEHDYFLTVTAQAEKDAKSAGYQFVRTEGYVYADPHPGTVPLKLYWKGNDNFLAGTRQSEQDALADHYQFVRIEGYAVRDPQTFLADQTVDYVPVIAQRRGKSVSALAKQFGGLNEAAAALGFGGVQALQNAIEAFCGGSSSQGSLRSRG